MTDFENRTDWAEAFLHAMGTAPNGGNTAAVVAWETKEGGHWNNDAKYNPLNTTWKLDGQNNPIKDNPAGVQAYASWEDGLRASVDTVQLNYYDALRAALAGSDPYAVSHALGASPWGTGQIDAFIPAALAEVQAEKGGEVGTPAPPTLPPPVQGPNWPGRLLRVATPFMEGQDILAWQEQMKHRGWAITADGVYGPQCDHVCRSFQQEKGLGVDGIVGPITWAATWNSPVTR
jgi:hypothetical protein